MRNFKIAGLFVAAALAFLVLAAPAGAEGVVLTDLDGKTTDIAAFKGKPTLFFFWTSWCPYCRSEIKTLERMVPQMRKDGLEVFAVNVGEEPSKLRRFIKRNSLDLKVLLDSEGNVADHYDVMGVPTYVIVDKAGKMISQEHTFPEDYKKLLKEKE